MPQPKVISKNGDSITLTWGSLFGSANGGSKLTSYKLQWKDGVNDSHSKVVQASHQTDTIRGVVAGRKYLIRIAARNSCGVGPYSEELKVSAAGCPSQPPAPVVSVKGKDVQIQWEESTTEENSPLREYQVLLKNKDGSYMEHKRYCNGASTKIMQTRMCLIPMLRIPELTGLAPRDPIQAKVRAINRNCQGDFSLTNTDGQKVVACPVQMTPVTASKKDITRTGISVHWDSMLDNEAGGQGLHITEFEVRWQKCETEKWRKNHSSMTSNLHLSHSNLDNTSCYRYMVRAYNQYCSGEWSPPKEFTTGQPPESLDAPAVEIVDNQDFGEDEPAQGVMISWPAPDTEQRVTGYGIFIGTSSGEYKEDKSLCDGMAERIIKQRFCHLPMSTFWSGTFRKDQGTLISVKVQAFNAKGESELSPWNVEGAKVEKVPFQMNKPSGSRKANENAIILDWNDMRNPLDGGSPVTTYDLQYKKHNNEADWQEVVGGTTPYLQTTYTHDDRKPDQVLHYRIRAKNRWGWGQFSTPNLVMETAKAPERVATAETTIEPQTGAVKIEWEVPDDNGSGITDYNVELKAADATWLATNDCRDKKSIMQSTDTSRQLLVCKVQMSTLRNMFKLPFDQLVEIRIRALNLAGLGPWSRANSVGVTVKSEPQQMKKPQRGEQTSETRIHAKWDSLFLKEETGDSMILGYVLQDDGEEIYSGMETQAIFAADEEKVYKLRVAARNIYGLSKWSEVLAIKAGAIPPEVRTIESSNIANNQIEIQWNKPGKDEIEEYEVQIFVKSKDMFEVVPSLCDGSDPDVVDHRTCVLRSKVLNRDYGYHHGDLLIVKVRARNSLGWGAWSKPNTTGATVFKLVPLGG